MPSDEADLAHAVAADVVPVLEQVGVLKKHLGALLLGGACHKVAVGRERLLASGLLKDVAHVGVLDHPEHALGTHDALGPARREGLELVHVEGATALVDEGLDVVLKHLGVVVLLGVLHGVDPGGGAEGAAEVETPGVHELGEGHVAVLGLHDHGLLLQAAHDGLELGELLGAHHVGLVEDERGAELDLLDEQVLDVVLLNVLGEQVAAARELVEHARAVHHGHDVVQGKRRVALVGALVAEARDGVGDGDGLADARGLDDDVVEVARVGDAAQLACQVVGQRAAQAPVGHGDEVAVYLRQAALLDEAGVDVDLADVVDDDGGADALLVGEDVVEQGGLACAEIAGEQDDLCGRVGVCHDVRALLARDVARPGLNPAVCKTRRIIGATL